MILSSYDSRKKQIGCLKERRAEPSDDTFEVT